MRITKRERQLLAITITAIVLGINYVVILPLARSWGDTGRKLAGHAFRSRGNRGALASGAS